MSKKGIYTGVRMKCEESGISKQGWLAAWPLGLTELRVPAVSKVTEWPVVLLCLVVLQLA